MAIPTTDGLNTKFYLVPNGTAVATVGNIETAIATAKQIENIVTFGDFDFGTFNVSTLAVFGGNMVKNFGSKTVGNVAAQVVFDAANATGQAEIKSMHELKTRRILVVELEDTPTAGATPHPTYLVVQVGIAALSMPLAQDSSVVYNATIEFCEIPATWEAAGTTV